MEVQMNRILAIVAAVAFMIASLSGCFAEEIEITELFVTASLLNGRSGPRKTASIEARFDQGDILQALEWNEDHKWIEVIGGETDTVWVWWEYVAERTDEFYVWNNWGTKIKIRRTPFGRVVGYLKNDGEVIIDRVVMNWGHCNRGWIDLNFVTEED